MATLPEGAKASMRDDVQRSGWALGPWTDEPDRVEWRAHGFVCLVLRQPRSGHLCGYVGVEPGHPWHGKDYASCVDIDGEWPEAHGGITYSAECHGNVCHVPALGEPEHLFWQGFDAMHCGDASPRDISENSGFSVWGGEYRDVRYMVHATEKLAQHAARVAKP